MDVGRHRLLSYHEVLCKMGTFTKLDRSSTQMVLGLDLMRSLRSAIKIVYLLVSFADERSFCMLHLR